MLGLKIIIVISINAAPCYLKNECDKGGNECDKGGILIFGICGGFKCVGSVEFVV